MSIFSRQPERDVFDAPSNLAENLTGDYAIDTTHTRLGFSARHAMVTTVRGGFTDFEGNARIDTDDPAASHVEIVINAASIDTGVADRDGHLKSADFFDVENNPRISFTSTKVERDGDVLGHHRRPRHQGRHQARHHRVRADRLGQGPLRQHARRLRGRDRHQPQGVGPHLERRARDRRRPRLRQGQARVRRLRRQEGLTHHRPSDATSRRRRNFTAERAQLHRRAGASFSARSASPGAPARRNPDARSDGLTV